MRAFIFLMIVCTPFAAQAYVGPGAGLGAIAVAVAIVLGLLLLVVGFLWYPLKRLLRGKKSEAGKNTAAGAED